MNNATLSQLVPLHGINTLHKKAGASINAIVQQVRRNEATATKQLAPVAKYFKGQTEQETCANIWQYLKSHVPYKADGFQEQVIKLPAALIRSGGDCKSYSLFTIGILNNLGIPAHYRLVTFNPTTPNQAHIYTVTNSGLIIDAVFDKFNAEKPYFTKKDIQTMTALRSVGSTVGATINPEKFVDSVVKEAINGKMSQTLINVGKGFSYGRLSPMPIKLLFRGARFAFQWAFASNIGGLATYYFKTSYQARQVAKRSYEALGGNSYNLYLAASEGKSKPIIKGVKKQLTKLAADYNGVDFENSPNSPLLKFWQRSKVGVVAETAGAAAGTTATVTSLMLLLKYLIDETTLVEKVSDEIKNEGGNNTTVTPPYEDNTSGPNTSGSSNNSILPIGIAAALLLS